MRRVAAVCLALLVLAAGRAECLELKNGRSSYGPLFGATRPGNKFLPGDFLYFNFEIGNLTPKDKTGIVVYSQSMEIIDKDNKLILKDGAPAPVEIPLMIGAPLRTYVQFALRPDTAPGPYKLKVSVSDRGATPEVTKLLEYDFEVLKPSFNFVATSCEAVLFAGQDLHLTFGVTGMKHDEKAKKADASDIDVDVVMRVLDEAGKSSFVMPFTNNLKDLHDKATFDTTKMPWVPVSTAVAMTRVGRFTLEIQANDKLSGERITLRLPVTVLDAAPYVNSSK